MEYGQIINDNDRKADHLISHILRMVAYIMMLLLFISWYFNIHIFEFRSDFVIIILLLLFPSICGAFYEKVRVWMKYINLICCLIVCGIIMAEFIEYTFVISTVPLILALLYFNKRLSIFTMIATAMNVVSSTVINRFGFTNFIAGKWYFSQKVVEELVIRGVEYIFIAMITVYLSDYCIKLFIRSCNDANEVKRNRDGLDTIVENVDTLFCAKSYQEISVIALMIIKNLLVSLESEHTDFEGYIAIREGEVFFLGVDEAIEPKEFMIHDGKVLVEIGGKEYDLDMVEAGESNTVFVNKDKLTMFFYEEGEMKAFVILHMHLDQNDVVLNKLVRVLYRNIKLAISNIKLSHDMYLTQEELVRAFSEISESKSGQTGAHIKRVSEYMKIMAETMDLDREEKDSLVIASMLHDIGKLLIPENILEKPGKLTSEEFEVIKTHVHLGYKLLEFCPGRIMEIARVIALQHHEKWDGTGYLGMKGDEIDYYSRVMAVVDVFDALMSKRSYKERWNIQDAYNEIVGQSGKHFDPEVVELFKIHFNEFLDVLSNYPDDEKIA